jgi:hypothetical protein
MSNRNIWFRAKGRYDQFLGPSTEGNYSKQHFSSNRSVPPVLATPVSFHNCEVQYEGRAQQFVPPLPPELQPDFVIITGKRPALLTNIIGPNAIGGMRNESSAMLGPLQPRRRTAPRSWASAKIYLQKNNGLVAANNQPGETCKLSITASDYPLSKRLIKEEVTLVARLALVEHIVHSSPHNYYSSRKFMHSRYCREPIVLHAFALRVEVCNV